MEVQLRHYSGPYSREIDQICKIADLLEYNECRQILKPFGLDLLRFEERHCEPAYCFVQRGNDVVPKNAKFYEIPVVKAICKKLKNGEVDLEGDDDEI